MLCDHRNRTCDPQGHEDGYNVSWHCSDCGTVVRMKEGSCPCHRLQTIELDCPPGAPRPGDLIADVIAGTGLPQREDVSRVFGNWTWDYTDIPRDQWQKAKPILKERVTKLYNDGVIRYGSW